jgi:hypothetical protein
MTLHLSVVGRGVAIQVSDRHISYKGHPAGGLHDVYANKNVVFAPRYGLVTLGYTGLAYLEHVPTDEWIAHRLWLDDLPPVAIKFRDPPEKWPDLGQAVDTLREELNRVFSVQRGENTLTVAIAGWQWARRSSLLRGVAWALSNEGTPEFTVRRHPRFSAADPVIAFGSHPPLRRAEHRQLEQAVSSSSSSDEMEQLLTSTITAHAARTHTIGPDSIVIRLDPTQPPEVRIRCSQAVPPRAVIRYKGRDNNLTYSPWVVMKNAVMRPTAGTGGNFEWSSDGINVEIAGSANANYGGLRAQQRTPEHGPPCRAPLPSPPFPGPIVTPPATGSP